MNGVQVSGQSGEIRLIFEPELDVAHTRSLYRELDEALAARQPLSLDASQVQRVDAATLQLLAAFCCAARDAGMPVRWNGTSAVLRSAVTLLDLNEILGQPS
jgi:ABC-type transporter Mla MlaB component